MATIKLKNSQVKDRIPQPGDLDVGGELAVNHHADNPGIFLKDTAGVVRKIAGTGAVGATDATTTAKGVVQLADAAAVTAGTAGLVVDAAQLKAAVAAEDLWDRTGTTVSPTNDGDSLELTSGGTAGVSLDPGTPTSPLVRDSAGRLLVGTTAAQTSSPLEVVTGIGIKRNGVPANAGANVGLLRFSDNQGVGDYCSIQALSDGIPSATSLPGRLTFSTTPSGGATPVERMRIGADGNVLIGGTLPASPNITLNANGSITSLSNTHTIGVVALNAGTAAGPAISTSTGGAANDLFSGKRRDTSATTIRITGGGVYYGVTTTIQAIASERRLKENIVPVDSSTAWKTIKETPYYSYNFIGTDATQVNYGPMADEVPAEMRVATDQSDDVGVIHSYDNGMLQARLYVALQTALTRIETLEAKVKAAGL